MATKRSAPLVGILLTAALCFVAATGLRGCMHEHSRPVGHGDIDFGISPTGSQIVFNAVGSGGRDLYLLDLKTWRVVQLTRSSDYEGNPAFSPDGKSVVYAAGVTGDRADHLFIRSLNGTQVKQLTSEDYNEDYNDESPSFSPDGTHIVFARNLTYGWGGLAASWGSDGIICVMRSDGSQLRRVTPEPLTATGPHFSSDEKTILFWAVTDEADFPCNLYTVNSDGTQTPRKLTSDGQSREPVISPDARQIAFARGHYSPDHQIHIMSTHSKATRQLTQVAGGCFKPHFSPDAKRLFFLVESWPNGPSGTPKYALWQVGTDGKNATQVADSSLFDDPLNWKH